MENHAAEEETREIIHEEQVPHAWGNWKVWLLIGILLFGAITHTFFILHVVGKNVKAEWNLGRPPTAPN